MRTMSETTGGTADETGHRGGGAPVPAAGEPDGVPPAPSDPEDPPADPGEPLNPA